MDKHIVKKESDSISAQRENELQQYIKPFFPFIQFTYSHTSLSSDGKHTHIKAEQHHYQNGRLDSKRFEGTLDGDYLGYVTKMIEDQMNLMFNMMKQLLPFKLW